MLSCGTMCLRVLAISYHMKIFHFERIHNTHTPLLQTNYSQICIHRRNVERQKKNPPRAFMHTIPVRGAPHIAHTSLQTCTNYTHLHSHTHTPTSECNTIYNTVPVVVIIYQVCVLNNV